MLEPQLVNHRFPDVTFANIRAEIDRTDVAADIKATVARGYLTRAGATRHVAMIEALHRDAIRFTAAFQLSLAGLPARYDAPAHGISWRDRRAWLRAELDRRQRAYSDALASGKSAEAPAIIQFDRLAALLGIYEDGHDFPDGPKGFAAIFSEMRDEIPGRRHADFRLYLDTAAAVAAPTLFGEASGLAAGHKGPNHDRSRHTA